MTIEAERGEADWDDANRVRFSVSIVKQGRHQFYTLTMPSEVLAETCVVTSRKEDPKKGFQRTLDKKRAEEIARYIDEDLGTIPNSIVLSAQPSAQLRVVGRGKTLEFSKVPDAFLILDGQHRVYGFSLAKTSLRVPVIIYNGLSRKEETRLFIDINTKQRPVPSQLLLDIKQLAEIETDTEEMLRDVFDLFNQKKNSAMAGLMSPSEAAKGKITRVTFNQSVKPHLGLFSDRSSEEIYSILNAYLTAVTAEIAKKTSEPLLSRAVIFRSFIGIFRSVAQRVVDRYGQQYTASNFQEVVAPIFANLQMKRFESAGTNWSGLRTYLEQRLKSKLEL
jgi:DGQHR domain-containing protein